ncbi:hypothetical protein KIN20_000127 [Parelaphostrongylus tenuis]|uniref:Uncharacterized protein n=1 Tax=Parelaphostrongylus tenuis TaxID=148309 RepID=A0AAD5LUY7_PARTN|nr:hypothetical protein KIN20_000127 [Parelaphostrongylus tenuis]
MHEPPLIAFTHSFMWIYRLHEQVSCLMKWDGHHIVMIHPTKFRHGTMLVKIPPKEDKTSALVEHLPFLINAKLSHACLCTTTPLYKKAELNGISN